MRCVTSLYLTYFIHSSLHLSILHPCCAPSPSLSPLVAITLFSLCESICFVMFVCFLFQMPRVSESLQCLAVPLPAGRESRGVRTRILCHLCFSGRPRVLCPLDSFPRGLSGGTQVTLIKVCWKEWRWSAPDKPTVMICNGNTPQSGQLKQQTFLFLLVLEAGSPRPCVPAWWAPSSWLAEGRLLTAFSRGGETAYKLPGLFLFL